MVALDAHHFPASPDFLMLDVGPGSGILAEWYARERPVVAVEFNETLAREVGQRTAPCQLSSCCGDAQGLPVRDESVEGVIVLEVLEHVDDPDRVLAEAFRVLKPGGVVCVAVPTSYTEAVYSRVHPRYMSNAGHVRVFKKKDLVERLERQGFTVSLVKTEHLEPALAWVVHSILRSEVHPTGLILQHTSVVPKIVRGVARVERTRGIGRIVPWTRRRFGKSWYVYARKTP